MSIRRHSAGEAAEEGTVEVELAARLEPREVRTKSSRSSGWGRGDGKAE